MEAGKQAPNAWRVAVMLFLANCLNFYDRAIPGILTEPIRIEFGLQDTQLGLAAAAFTVVYAVVGIPIGRLADSRSRKVIMCVGLIVWSLFTGVNGLVWSFATFLVVRVAVGIGEASYSPAAVSMIGDLFPSAKRSRALALYWLALPVGLILAFFTTGKIVQAFGTWRAPFFVAVVPGFLLALCMLTIREPVRGGAEAAHAPQRPVGQPVRLLLGIRTLWWLTLAGIASNFSAYTAGSFITPLLQRYFALPLGQAAVNAGAILGLAGLAGLVGGGWAADKAHAQSERGRLLYGAVAVTAAAGMTWYALTLGTDAVTAFTAIFATGWVLQYQYYVCVYPAIQDVVEPRLRGIATALYFAALYLLGGAFGPVVVGVLSDRYARAAQVAAGAPDMAEPFRAIGLHGAMFLIPVALAATAAAMFAAAGTFRADAATMRRRMTEA